MSCHDRSSLVCPPFCSHTFRSNATKLPSFSSTTRENPILLPHFRKMAGFLDVDKGLGRVSRPIAQSEDDNLSAQLLQSPDINHLIIVCCHAIWRGGQCPDKEESEWSVNRATFNCDVFI